MSVPRLFGMGQESTPGPPVAPPDRFQVYVWCPRCGEWVTRLFANPNLRCADCRAKEHNA